MGSLRFKEVEHKFVIADDTFDHAAFAEAIRRLAPHRQIEVRVEDTYYLVKSLPDHVYRHRFDQELQHLSVKSLGADSECRLEVNLDLGHHRGNQRSRVDAFLAPLGVSWQGTVTKDVKAFYFENCEIVYYEASFDGRRLTCVEFEAQGLSDMATALEVLARYERELGFDPATRAKQSLFQLLVLPVIERLATHNSDDSWSNAGHQ